MFGLRKQEGEEDTWGMVYVYDDLQYAFVLSVLLLFPFFFTFFSLAYTIAYSYVFHSIFVGFGWIGAE